MFSERVTVLALLMLVLAIHRPVHADVSARALEARLYAPCCWNGTLDVYESELARELRHEIDARLAHGESTKQIQADIVERFGDRVLASRDSRPEILGGLFMGGAMIASAAIIAIFVRRSIRKGRRERPFPPDDRSLRDDADRDAQLDRELAGFE